MAVHSAFTIVGVLCLLGAAVLLWLNQVEHLFPHSDSWRSFLLKWLPLNSKPKGSPILFSSKPNATDNDVAAVQLETHYRTTSPSGQFSVSYAVWQAKAEANAWVKINERQAWFSAKWRLERDHLMSLKVTDQMLPFGHGTLFGAYYPCPWTLDKTPSVFEQFDGGKFTCGLAEIHQAFVQGRRQKDLNPCVVYSFGSNNEDAFERNVNLRTHNFCEIHVFDPTSRPLKQYHFHSVGLSLNTSHFVFDGKTFLAKNLTTHMTELHHSCLDLLKIDVEGAEFPILWGTDWSKLCVGQLLLELHPRVVSGGLRLKSLSDLFLRLEVAGFRLFSSEPVCLGCGSAMEVAFLHKDWTPQHGRRMPQLTRSRTN